MGQNFLQLGIKEQINDALKQSGILKPTPVQMQAIPVILQGKDVVVQSQTGTGKTLAFLLPILENIKIDKNCVQALIITPTRELALQVTKVTKEIGDKLNVKSLTVYGGQAVDRQLKKLEKSPHVIIGTPGRLLDHLRRNTLNLNGVSMLVLDEADQMLHMGFLEEVEKLISETSPKRQTMLFSATIPPKIRALCTRYMNKPLDIRTASPNITLDEIKQVVVELKEEEKLDKLCSMINEYHPYLAMVFCHTKQRVIKLTQDLAQRGYLVDELHGDLSQAKRTQAMRRFSSAKLQVLVVTDIAARGIDVEGVTHVFNYDIPHDAESYIHRIGRTGRAGNTGMAITFVNPRQYNYLRLIEQGISANLIGQKRPEKTSIPTKKEVISKTDSAKSSFNKTETKGIRTAKKAYRGTPSRAQDKDRVKGRPEKDFSNPRSKNRVKTNKRRS